MPLPQVSTRVLLGCYSVATRAREVAAVSTRLTWLWVVAARLPQGCHKVVVIALVVVVVVVAAVTDIK